MIPLANPYANYKAHEKEICQAIHTVLEDGVYVGGHHVEKFEHQFAHFIGVKHAIGVNSGTDALTIAMLALKLDAISVPANTALATVAAVIDAGAIPVLVGPDAAAGLSVHLYGKAAIYPESMIEDCAQACGGFWGKKRLGSIGLLGCFSFYPTKNLGAIGDGGMIVTDDDDLAAICRETREYGWSGKRVPRRIGFNSRLDPIQAAILSVKLKWLDEENDRRRNIARKYCAGIGDLVKTPDPTNHCFHLYVIECDRRDELAEYLRQRDIGTGIHYPTPIYNEPFYADKVKSYSAIKPIVNELSQRILSLPMYPELIDAEVDSVIETIRAFYG